MVVVGVLRASSNVSGLQTMDFDQTFGKKFRSQVSKVYGGGEPPWSAAVGRPPWFLQTMLTRGGELSY